MENTGKRKRCRPSPIEPTPAISASELPASGAGESAEQEEEMEKFYALLGSIRAMREQCRVSAQKRAKKKNEAAPPLWKPTFEMEDFKDAAKICDEKGKERVKRNEGDEEGNSSSSGSLDLCFGLKRL